MKEALKKKEKRYEEQKKRVGRMSIHKVRGLIQLINFKIAHKYQ
jgi:hypothetical protein